jgi:hypothetical protein
MAFVLSALLVLGMVEAQERYLGIFYSSSAVCAGIGQQVTLVVGCQNGDTLSEQLLLLPGGATPPRYTLAVYNAPGCNAANLVLTYPNIPQDGTTCVPSSIGQSSVILTATSISPPAAVTTTTIVGSVLGGLATIVLIVVLMRFLELCFCKREPVQYLPTMSVNNPAAEAAAAIPEFR